MIKFSSRVPPIGNATRVAVHIVQSVPEIDMNEPIVHQKHTNVLSVKNLSIATNIDVITKKYIQRMQLLPQYQPQLVREKPQPNLRQEVVIAS